MRLDEDFAFMRLKFWQWMIGKPDLLRNSKSKALREMLNKSKTKMDSPRLV